MKPTNYTKFLLFSLLIILALGMSSISVFAGGGSSGGTASGDGGFGSTSSANNCCGGGDGGNSVSSPSVSSFGGNGGGNGPSWPECTPGTTSTQACGTDVGACVSGTQTRTCDASGYWGAFGACGGTYVAPVVEICDGIDNDCDGSIDEDGVCAPVIAGLPDHVIIEDSGLNANLTDLHVFTADPDDPVASLTYTIVGETAPGTVGCVVDSNQYIDCTPLADQYGASTVTVQVSDGINTDTDDFVVLVTNVNDAPVFGPLPDQYLQQGSGYNNNLIDLHAYVNDSDNTLADMTFTVVGQTNPTVATCLVDSNRYIDCLAIANNTGMTDVTVQVSDGGLTATDTFTVYVADFINGTAIILIYPNGGEVLRGDVNVTWWAVNNEGHNLTIELEYSVDNGATWNMIAAGEENDGIYTWDTTGYPDVAGYLLRAGARDVVDNDIVYDMTDFTFTVNNIIPNGDIDILRHSLFIANVGYINPGGDQVRAGEDVSLRITVKNDGDFRLDNVRIGALVHDWGDRDRAGPFDLTEGETETRTLLLRVPPDAEPGLYPLRITMYNEDMHRVKYRDVEVIE